jgi:hypothetical protein
VHFAPLSLTLLGAERVSGESEREVAAAAAAARRGLLLLPESLREREKLKCEI